VKRKDSNKPKPPTHFEQVPLAIVKKIAKPEVPSDRIRPSGMVKP